MKPTYRLGLSTLVLALSILPRVAPAGTLTDNFNVSVNYLTNGVPGTIWDGVYFGAGEFVNTGTLGPGTTLQCNANISTAGELTLQTTGTAWENADDDGFFLFKVVKGDFSAIVKVVTPFNNAAYNTAGLQARAFAAGGNAFNGSENFVSWTRFDEFNFPNYLRSEVNGGVTQINPGNYPNSAYWLRMDRVGNVFRFYQRTNSTDTWIPVTFPAPVSGTNLTRSDLANQPLEVGIMHATFNGQLGVQFSNFSITATNFDSFATPPSPPSGIVLSNTTTGGLNVAWTPAAGSSGSVVVIYTGTNAAVKETPINGTTYNGNASFGLGDMLLSTSYSVVYAGSGSSVTVSNILTPGNYNVSVFSYTGAGSLISYNHQPVSTSFTITPNPISAQVQVVGPDILVTFSANIGKWYFLQYSDSLSPTNWQNVVPGPVLGTNIVMNMVHSGGASAPQRYYRVLQVDPFFALQFRNNAITSLQRDDDSQVTQYLSGGSRLGDAIIRYRQTGTNWLTARTSSLSGVASVTYSNSPDGTQYKADYMITNGLSGGPLVFESVFTLSQETFLWSFNITNLSAATVQIGDLAIPLPMNTTFSNPTNSVFKHSYIEGYGSFIYWMRPDSVGPFLVMTPSSNTKLEYWDKLSGEAGDGYEAFIYSAAAGAIDATNFPTVITAGQRWRQPNTSLSLAAGGSQTHSFNFEWANDYDGVRQALVNDGSIDVHVIPGMTVPTNLTALVALRTTQTIEAVNAEFPAATQITSLGTTNVGTNGTYQLYQVQFSQLGENELTIQYGAGQSTYLEFFVTEPVETLIKKRAAFLVSKQTTDSSKWYYGLYCDWNMNDEQLITPDNHDTLGTSFQVYEIASDDAGESRPAFMAVKESVYPVQSEVTSLDLYIQPFDWGNGLVGGLQRTTNESSPYGVYGVPDWKTNRLNNTLSLGRGYDYPHMIVMYYGMYQVAKYHPEITTTLAATNYLIRAYGTANALWNFGGSQATQVGLMNELVIVDLINSLQAEGFTTQAATLRSLWETKVALYVAGNQDLFASEYAFDSTGFESQQAYAKYAIQHAGSDAAMGSGNVSAFIQNAQKYMNTEINANVFDRGWLETAYYYYGSDYRSDAGDDYIVTYMAQMGGWGLLDYAFYYATNSPDYLRLGIASYLNGWSTMNTGTPESNYGFWYPGIANDGGCGGGYEPSPYNSTWLGGQPMHRGAWYYSAEENLGFCGALRSAATVLSDDPIFGRVALLGTWQQVTNSNQIIPLDGVRRRFHAMLNTSTLHLVLDNDRFAENQPIVCTDDQSFTGFSMESEVTSAHTATLHLTVSVSGSYTISNENGVVTTLSLTAGQEAVVSLPIDASATAQPFTITR